MATLGVVPSQYARLRVYRLAVEIAAAVHRSVADWPSFDRWTCGQQLVRAADSVGANIAEADGRYRGPDRRRLLFIARGSLHEVEHWIRLARGRGLPVDVGEAQIDETARMLNGLIRSAARLE